MQIVCTDKQTNKNRYVLPDLESDHPEQNADAVNCTIALQQRCSRFTSTWTFLCCSDRQDMQHDIGVCLQVDLYGCIDLQNLIDPWFLTMLGKQTKHKVHCTAAFEEERKLQDPTV